VTTITTSTAKRRTAAPIAPEGIHRTSAHLYYFNGVEIGPGVTTITKVLDAPALTGWKMDQVARTAIDNAERLLEDRESGRTEAAVSWLKTLPTTAMDRGSRIHQALEHILLRRPHVAVDPQDAAAVAGARQWLNQHKVRPIEIEAFLVNRTLGYGGTCDLIAEIDGETWLLDWKTGKSVAWPSGAVYDDMRLQLAAYANAEFLARVADATEYPLPPITRHGILHVTEGGTRLYDAAVTDADWTAFRACAHLYRWRKGSSR
jgi:hypothetical protein